MSKKNVTKQKEWTKKSAFQGLRLFKDVNHRLETQILPSNLGKVRNRYISLLFFRNSLNISIFSNWWWNFTFLAFFAFFLLQKWIRKSAIKTANIDIHTVKCKVHFFAFFAIERPWTSSYWNITAVNWSQREVVYMIERKILQVIYRRTRQ